ncbi:MAG: phosphomethylpyrimidine synthase ThiC, partial [Burkholderiales bacterium]|nr:phosphomethylpyrimidine synthase ThiC [Burkholderiales bacterium]
MNAPEFPADRALDERLSLTRQPFPDSSKVYVAGSRADLRVPMREIALSNGERVTVYDTSGPYTDPKTDIDVRRGLAAVREGWIADRADTEAYVGRDAAAIDDGARNDERGL